MANAIIDTFDLWTTAQNLKTSNRGLSASNQSLLGIKKLRELILELAISGKLVPQDTLDEPASVLLKKFEIEKTSLPITEDEIPFELPLGWDWCRLENVGITNIGLTYSPKDISDVGVPVLRSSNIQNGEISLEDLVRVNKDINEKVLVKNGDLLICARNGSKNLVGKCALIKELSEKSAFGAFMAIFRSDFNNYIKLFIESPIYRRSLEGVATTTINQITQGNLKNTLIALPPLAEQHRIVAKVDELMALCDQLEQQQTNTNEAHQTLVDTLLGTLTNAENPAAFEEAWQRIAYHFDTLLTTEHSIDQLKQTILQLAVMGKLVPQNPDDEPASELLKKIAKEKARLVKEGRIKNQIPLPKIGDFEKTLLLPNGWDFVRLGELANRIGSGSTPRGGSSVYENDGIIFLRSQNIWNHGLELDDVVFISKETHTKMSNTVVFPNDILLNITGASLGRCTIFPEHIAEANVSQHVTIIRPTENATKYYLHLCMLSPYFQNLVWSRQVGMAREGLSKKVLELFEIPMPPLAEQHRIVAKVNELFALCDAMKERLRDAQALQNQLAVAVVEQAV